MNTFERNFREQVRDMTKDQLLEHVIQRQIINYTKFHACVVNDWVRNRLKQIHEKPEFKVLSTERYKTVHGMVQRYTVAKDRRVGVVDILWEAAEHFGLSFECMRKYWYYYQL